LLRTSFTKNSIGWYHGVWLYCKAVEVIAHSKSG